MKLTLMFREYCSLCHAMRDALKPLQEEYGFELEIFDVDEDPLLEEKYNELVRNGNLPLAFGRSQTARASGGEGRLNPPGKTSPAEKAV